MFPSSTRRIVPPTGPMYVDQIAEMDVLLGRGTGPNDNVGNQIFRNLVKSRREEYLNAKTPDARQRIFKSTIALLHANGGRFLKKVGDPPTIAAGGGGASSDHGAGGVNTKQIYQIVTDPKTLMYKAKQQFRYAKDVKNKEGDQEAKGNGQQFKAAQYEAAVRTAVASAPAPPPRASIMTGMLQHLSKERSSTGSLASLKQRPQESKQAPSSTDPTTTRRNLPGMLPTIPAALPRPMVGSSPPPAGTEFLALQNQAPQPPSKPSSLSASTDFLSRHSKGPASFSLSASSGFLASQQQGKAASQPAPKHFSLSASTDFLTQQVKAPQHAPKQFSLAASTEFLARQQGKASQPAAKPFSLSASTDFLANQTKSTAPFSLTANTDFLARQATKAPAAPSTLQAKSSNQQDLLQNWLLRSQERNILALSKHRLLSTTTSNATTVSKMSSEALQGPAATTTPMATSTPGPVGAQANAINQAIDNDARAFLSSFVAAAAAADKGGRAGADAPCLTAHSAASIAASLLLQQSITNPVAAESNNSILSRLLSTNETQWPKRQDQHDSRDRSSPTVIGGRDTVAGALPGNLPTRPTRQDQINDLILDGSTTNSNAGAAAAIVDTYNCVHHLDSVGSRREEQRPKVPHLIADTDDMTGPSESKKRNIAAIARSESSTDDSATVKRRTKRKGLSKYRPIHSSRHEEDSAVPADPLSLIPQSSLERSTTSNCSRDSAMERAKQREAFVDQFIGKLIQEQKKLRKIEGHR